jgi:MoxR-like ATPase
MARKIKADETEAQDGETTRAALQDIVTQLNDTFIARADAIRAMMLAYLSAEHYLLVGEPGVAKTALAVCFAGHLREASFFKTTFGSFTPPEAVFGPMSINKFKQGQYKTETAGMLPEADHGFLDEYLKASDGLVNSLLTINNEREFEGKKTPLMTLGMATNWPEMLSRSDNIAALYDRTLLRVVVEDVEAEDDVADVLEKIEAVDAYSPRSTITLADLKAAQEEVKAVEISRDIRKLMANVRKRLGPQELPGGDIKEGVQISSRRLGKLQRVLKANAWMNGRDEVTVEDFEVLQWGLWSDQSDIEKVHAVLGTVDQEAKQEVVKLIDTGRTAYQDLARAGFGTARMNATMAKIGKVAAEAAELYNRPIFTARGRDEIKQAMEGLKQDFKAIKIKVEEAKQHG